MTGRLGHSRPLGVGVCGTHRGRDCSCALQPARERPCGMPTSIDNALALMARGPTNF